MCTRGSVGCVNAACAHAGLFHWRAELPLGEMARLGPVRSRVGLALGTQLGGGYLPLQPTQGLELSAGTNWGQRNLSTSPEGCNDRNQRRRCEGLYFAGKSVSISSIVLMKLPVGPLKSF